VLGIALFPRNPGAVPASVRDGEPTAESRPPRRKVRVSGNRRATRPRGDRSPVGVRVVDVRAWSDVEGPKRVSELREELDCEVYRS
jgi:hypothetical protein